MASPEATLLQNGFLVIKKDFMHDVLSWLSMINLFDLEMFVKVIVRATAKGTVQIIFLLL